MIALIIAILTLGLLPGPEPTSGDTTEVVVIGTVHTPTRNYTESALLEILNLVRPDVILLELENSFFTDSLALKPEMHELSLETRAVSSYQQVTGIVLRPYDIELNGTYRGNGYFSQEQETSKAISELYSRNALSDEARYLFESLLTFSHLRDQFIYDRPEVINSRSCDAVIERKQTYQFKGLRRIVALTPGLRQYRTHTVAADIFWTRRNEAMVNNILRYADEFAGKRIAVLCGFEHRYYIVSALSKMSPGSQTIRLREYWTYEAHPNLR